MFKFKGISSEDMQVIIEEEEHFIARASQRYETIEIEGRDGAIFNELGYSVVERPIYVQCLNINKIDDILAWLNGEGEFEYKGRKTTARFYSQLEPQRSSYIRIIDTTFIRDPFWCKANEEYTLVKDRKDKTVEGESIDLTDSAEMRFKSFGISGNSRQETREESYNLAKVQDKVQNGLTQVIEKGGICHVTGDSTGSFAFDTGTTLQPGNYYVKVDILEGSVSDFIFFVWSITTQSDIHSNFSVNKMVPFTITQEHRLVVACRPKNGSTTDTNVRLTLLVADNPNNTEFIQHGTSPSSDYPSEIKCCGDNVNLLPNNFESTTRNGLTLTKNVDGSIKVSGTTTAQTDVYLYGSYTGTEKLLTLAKGESFAIKGTKTSNIQIYTNEGYSNDGTDFVKTVESSSASITYVMYRFLKGVTYDTVIYPKIVKGTNVGGYSPYGQGCINEVICNKNFIVLKDIEETVKGGVTYSCKNGIFKINGTVTATFELDFPYFQLPLGDYIYTMNKEGTSSGSYAMYVRIGSFGNYTTWPQGNGTKFTIVDNKENIFVKMHFNTNVVFNNVSFKLQIEKGTTATDYIEHQSQTFTIPTQQQMLEDDYFDWENEEEVHILKKKVFDGTETIGRANTNKTSSDNIYRYSFATEDMKTGLDSVVYSSHFLYAVGDTYSYNGISGSEGKTIYIRDEKFTNYTVEEFKTWLSEQYNAGTPVYAWYKLASPIRLPFTEEQKAVAKQIKNEVKSYKGVTHMYSTDDVSPNVEVTYFTPTDETINNQGNIQSRPVLRLEKTVSEAVELTINDIRFKYNFENDEYVEIDCEEKTVKYEGLNRNRSISIGYEFPKLNIGSNKTTMHDGDCIIKVLRKDRWL